MGGSRPGDALQISAEEVLGVAVGDRHHLREVDEGQPLLLVHLRTPAPPLPAPHLTFQLPNTRPHQLAFNSNKAKLPAQMPANNLPHEHSSASSSLRLAARKQACGPGWGPVNRTASIRQGGRGGRECERTIKLNSLRSQWTRPTRARPSTICSTAAYALPGSCSSLTCSPPQHQELPLHATPPSFPCHVARADVLSRLCTRALKQASSLLEHNQCVKWVNEDGAPNFRDKCAVNTSLKDVYHSTQPFPPLNDRFRNPHTISLSPTFTTPISSLPVWFGRKPAQVETLVYPLLTLLSAEAQTPTRRVPQACAPA